jgi:hypothetical protein
MGTRAGFYKSGKRNKEINRQKKQEEKRQRRLNKGGTAEPEEAETALEATASEETEAPPEAPIPQSEKAE